MLVAASALAAVLVAIATSFHHAPAGALLAGTVPDGRAEQESELAREQEPPLGHLRREVRPAHQEQDLRAGERGRSTGSIVMDWQYLLVTGRKREPAWPR